MANRTLHQYQSSLTRVQTLSGTILARGNIVAVMGYAKENGNSPSPETKANKGPKWRQLWFDFTQQTTFHGVRYITQPTPFPIRRLFWVLVTLGCLAGFFFITISRLLYLVGKPKAVNVEVIYAKTLTFPAVTVCNQNFFRGSKTFELGMYDQIDDRFRIDETLLLKDISKGSCTEGIFDIHKGTFHTTQQFKNQTDPLDVDRLTKKTCDFENGICEFYKWENSVSRWLRNSGPTSTPETGPDHDHTNVYGSYMYVEPLIGTQLKLKEQPSLISPFISSTVPICLQLAYSLRGLEKDLGTLQVYTRRPLMVEDSLRWGTKVPTDEEWELQHVELDSGLFQVVIKVAPGKGQLGDVAIDDVTIGPCGEFVENCRRTVKGTTYLGNQSTTADGQTCEKWDFTLNPPSWYFPDNPVNISNSCRNPNNTVDGPWCYARTGYSLTAQQCGVPFCECTQDQFKCGNNQCIHRLLACDGTANCADGTDETQGCVISPTCSFEKANVCGYNLDALGLVAKGKSSWLRYSGQIRNGILRKDFTLNSKLGHFLYLDSGSVTLAYRERVAVTTPWITDPKPFDQCFSFYLYNKPNALFPDAMGTLAVYQTFGRYHRRLLDVFEGNTKDIIWVAQSVTVPASFSAFYITIEASVGYSFYSDMAIDDAELRNGKCNVNCKDDEFACNTESASCITNTKVCDGHLDCENFADEDPVRCQVGPPICNFTTSAMCGYRDDSNPDYNGWKKLAGNDYVRVFDDSPSKDYVKRLVSPRWTPQRESCLGFHYVPNRFSSYCLLHVFQEFVDNRSRSYTVGGVVQGPTVDWTQGYVTLNGSEDMAVTFEARCTIPLRYKFDKFHKFDMKLTNVTIEPVSCEDKFDGLPFNCDFKDGNTCGYLDISQQNINWVSNPRGGMYTALPLHANVGMAEAVLLFPTLTVQDMSCVIIELASRNSYSGIVDVSIDSYNDPATNYRNFSFLNEPKFGVPIELSPGVHRLTLKVGVETGTGIDLFSVMISSECPTMPELERLPSDTTEPAQRHEGNSKGDTDDEGGYVDTAYPPYVVETPEEIPNYEDNLSGYYKTAGHQPEDLLYRCHWGGTTCSAANFSSQITDFGFCHTFNSGEDGYPLVKTAGTGSSAGLRLIFNIEQYDYMKGPQNDAGLKIFLSAQEEVARVRDLGLAVGPGAHAFVAVKLSQTKSLEAPWGKCGVQTLQYSDNYTYPTCVRECETAAIVNACGCRDAYMPGYTPDDPPICNVSTYLSCAVSTSDELGELSKDCSCTEPCQRDIFETQVSYASLSKQSVNQILSSDLERLRVNHLRALEVNNRADPEVMAQDLRLFDDLKVNYNGLLEFVKEDAWNKDRSFVVRVEKALKFVIGSILPGDLFKSVFGRLGLKNAFNGLYGPVRESFHTFSQQLLVNMEMLARECDKFIVNGNDRVLHQSFETDIILGRMSEAQRAYSKAFQLMQNVYNSSNLIFLRRDLPEKVFTDEQECYQADFSLVVVINQVLRLNEDIRSNFKTTIVEERLPVPPIGNNTNGPVDSSRVLISRPSKAVLVPILDHLISTMARMKSTLSKSSACLDEYYHFLQDLDNVYANINQNKRDLLSQMTLTQESLTVDDLLDFTEETEKLTDYHADLLQLSRDFASGMIKKESIANKFDEEKVSHALQDVTTFITRIQTRLIEPKRKMIQDVEEFIKNTYSKTLQEELRYSAYFPLSYSDKNVRSMNLWSRPQANYESSNDPHYSDDIFQLGNLKKFTEVHATKVLTELADWYTRPLSNAVNKFESNLLVHKNKVTAAFGNMQTQMTKFGQQTIMGQDFIRENFIAVDVFFAQLKYERTEQIKAYNGDSFFADVGGFMGLLLGGSVISLIEFLDLIIHNGCHKAKQRRLGHTQPDQEAAKVEMPLT